MDNDNGISRRKLLGSLALVGTASATAGAGTVAYITDNEDASFSFQAGSILLKTEPETVNFTSENGSQDTGSEMTETIEISNLGTLPVDELSVSDISMTADGDDLKLGADVTTLTFFGPDGSTTDLTEDPAQSLTALSNDLPLELMGDGDSTLSPQSTVKLKIGITYDYSEVTTNGGLLNADFEFTASQ